MLFLQPYKVCINSPRSPWTTSCPALFLLVPWLGYGLPSICQQADVVWDSGWLIWQLAFIKNLSHHESQCLAARVLTPGKHKRSHTLHLRLKMLFLALELLQAAKGNKVGHVEHHHARRSCCSILYIMTGGMDSVSFCQFDIFICTHVGICVCVVWSLGSLLKCDTLWSPAVTTPSVHSVILRFI